MRATGHNQLLKYGDNTDVVRNVLRWYEKYRNQPAELVADLHDCTTDEKCYAIFDYLVNHVRYLEDKPGYQFIKSPARLLADGVGDCKSMTLFLASCLHCLGVPHTIRFVNFDGGTQYTHVYVLAHDGSRIITLDAVERDPKGQPVYNYAREFARCLDTYYKN